MFIKFVDIDWIFLGVIFTLLCSLKICRMWLTRNHMFIYEISENLPRSFFKILKSPLFHSRAFQI